MFLFFNFVIILIFEIISNNIFVLHFQELIKENNDFEKNINYSSLFLKNYLEYKIITEIKIGTPPKKIPFYINSNIKAFRIKLGKLNENFNFNNYENYIPSKSSSFKNVSDTIDFNFYNYDYSFINESIILCKDKFCNKEIQIKNIKMQLENIKNNYTYSYGEFGLSNTKSINYILKDLKDIGIINSITITIEYISNNEGFIYIGEYPHIYNNNKYNENIFMTAYTIPIQGSTNQLKLKMNKLYIIDKNNNEYINFNNNIILFNIGLGIILCSKEYYDKIIEIFFNKYIKINICKINIEIKGRNKYYIISCKKKDEFKIEEFPSLYLFKQEFKYIFELNFKDLFLDINNIYYFLIIYFPFSDNIFEIGKPFFKKYQITYNEELNTIHYYNKLLNKNIIESDINNKSNNIKIKNNNKNNLYLILIILIIIILIFLILISIYFFKKIYKKRKIRTNEIDDEYEYDYNSSINIT